MFTIYFAKFFYFSPLFKMLAQTIRNFTQVDIVSDYSSQNLHKMELIRQHVGYQYDAMADSVNHLDYLREQVTAMERWLSLKSEQNS